MSVAIRAAHAFDGSSDSDATLLLRMRLAARRATSMRCWEVRAVFRRGISRTPLREA